MAINLQQAIDIGKYLVTQRLLGRKTLSPGINVRTAVPV